MNRHCRLVLACGVALTVVSAAAGQTPPIQKKTVQKTTYEDMLKNYAQGGGNYRFVSGDETLTSGDLVTVARKGAAKVTGRFVYADPTSHTLFIRPRAGQPPLAVPERDVERIERITPASGSTGKGTVRPAFESGDKAAPSYEIHTMTIHDGPYTTTYFYDDSLSPTERNELRAMEKAGSDVMQRELAVESLRDAVQYAATGSANVDVVQTGGYGFLSPYAYYYPGPYYYMTYGVYPMLPNVPYGNPYATLAPPIMTGGSQAVVVRENGNDARSMAELSKSLSEAETALAAARKNDTALRQHAVYDPRGNVVAVRLEQ